LGPGIVDNDLSYLKVGEGWSMKGSQGGVPVEERQNYTFKGMPNNGDFSLNMGPNQNYLVGNPFPSAIDANVVLRDNLIVTGGVIYCWSHFAKRDSHILKEYEGGYAPYNMSGGAKPYANDERIDNTGAIGDLKPERFIPIAHAFFIRI